MSYHLRELTEQDKDLIYNWRNADFIRLYMYHNEWIPYEEHDKWFKTTLKERSSYYRIFCNHEKPLGLVSFKECESEKKIYSWGFYIGDTEAPKGAATWMGRLALDYVFHLIGAKTIIGEALDFNKKSIAFHQRLGFKQDLHYKNTLDRNGQHIDIIRFVLKKEDWYEQKVKLDLHFT